jgi:hypothetical protein
MNPLPVAVSVVGCKSKQRWRSYMAQSAPSKQGTHSMPQGRVQSLRGWQQLSHSTKWHGGHLFCKMPTYTATLDSWQTRILLIRSYRAHIVPQEYGHAYQTFVTGGTKYLSQTCKGGGSGFCLNYKLTVILATC